MAASRPGRKHIVMWLPGLAEHGGIPRHNRTLSKVVSEYARERDALVTIVSLRDEAGFFDPAYLTRPVVGCEGKSARFGLECMASLRRGFDLLVVGVVDFGPMVPAARLRSPNSSILTITHGIEVWKPLPRRMRVALTQASAVISVSQFTAEFVARQHGVERSRIHVIPPSMDPDFLAMVAGARKRREPSGSKLLSISRLNEIDAPKGVQRVIEALPAIRRDVPDVRYTVIGTGDDRPRLESLAGELNVDDLCDFKGAVTDAELHADLGETDLFVLPSAKEGFGIVFLEAAAHERAVVGGNAGGTPEVVVDGVTGLLVDPADAGTLGSAVAELLPDERRRREMGLAGARRVRDSYGYEAFAERTTDLLHELIPR
jgi:glycosyltransferase involved in cell wall biosynthesis